MFVSVLFNEPKLLKYHLVRYDTEADKRFSALQRAEIAEMDTHCGTPIYDMSFSALQRAEIAEIRIALLERDLHIQFQCSSTSRNC